MKVQHICGDYDSFHKELIMKQAESIDVHVFRYTTRRMEMKQCNDRFVESYNSPIKYLRTPLFFKQRFEHVAKHFCDSHGCFDCDIIHAHMWFSDGWIAHAIKKRYGTPYIIAVRNSDLNNWYTLHLPWIWREGLEIIKNAERIICLSESYRIRLLKLLPIDIAELVRDRIIVIPNGVNSFWHEQCADEPRYLMGNSKIRLITVGRVEKNKNQTTVLKAVKKLRIKGFDIEYTIVGDLLDKDLEFIKNEPSVTYFPYSDKEKLVEVYKNADIFVMPSIHESFGLTYAEALTQGVPVIYTRGEGFDKQFADGEVGFPVSCMNEDEICSAIMKITYDYTSISQRCISNSKRYEWARIAQEYRIIYEEILK